ncbi:glycosyltransferase family 4 protein [Phycicoccus sp. CSK15P-2]|uniref:glycosyltransferase family 4 protein n=1 Tax=Phycicoccus sp. CSK15P-2 TaxID=2807627 RepID=UPI00194DCBEB|nr:glycosyltransferase family 4 protein [Phycicoccus sp. CSK15P-2]MBM6403495.1 glycosyltransferase family 4 protein [Phycicoccus sp. CSK15P-2]
MKVLLLTHYYAPEVGAPQHRWSALARHLCGTGHDLHVVAPAPHYPTGRLLPGHGDEVRGTVHQGEHGEVVHRVAFRPHRGGVGDRLADEAVAAADAVRIVRAGLGGWKPDVVVSTVPSLPMLWAGEQAARAAGAPFVAEVRDAWPDLLEVTDDWDDAPRPGVGGRARRRARRWLSFAGPWTTRVQRRADVVVTTTESFADVLRGRGMREVHVIRNAAHEVPDYTPVPRPVAGELRVLYAGTMGRAQGLSTAVRAAALAQQRGVHMILRLVGSGADRPSLQRLARETGGPVEILDPVPRQRMAEQYAWADTALVSLRPWPALEWTVPSKLYEIMGLGLHVTAVVAGEAREIVEGRGAGDVSAPGDVPGLASLWESLAADRDRLTVRASAREWVEEHAHAEALGAHYADLLTWAVASHGR